MLYFIPTPIGNLEDISQRSLNLLLNTPIIFCEDTRVTKKLINLLKERFKQHKNIEQKFISFHSHNEQVMINNLNADIFLSSDAVYVSDAGMPCISDPGALLVQFAQKNSIAYEVLPGANALLLALAASGFEGTNFYFHGFLPHKKEIREKELDKLLSFTCNVVLYESTHRILKLSKELALMAPARELFFIKEATKMYEKRFFGKAEEIYAKLQNSNLNGEWAVVIKGCEQESSRALLSVQDILNLSAPNKQKAKLLAKLTGKSVKEWYDMLNQNSKQSSSNGQS
ncbi:MAG: 16S rRNA (cytidine(1402)-2'-O)-methyltransferase [Campylobacteraceae bacterium]|jgi:16S rRNA (cytidine1402-2'-O)-methyltransferase|nr:16S rRNA (cytidine(1402)-2'-O)-methyltransferase [Campylobacteraceae bacterium]